MKGWILVTGATVAFAASLNASAASFDQKTERLPARQAIYQSWSLSDQQQDQLTSANKTFHGHMETLKDQKFDSAQARHEAMEEAALTHRQALAKVLDNEQMKVLEGLDQREAPRHAKDELMTALLDSWNLDDSQKKAIEDAQQQMREDLRARHKDKDTTESRKEHRQAMDNLREQQQERLAKVLSADQIKVLEMMRHVELRGPMGKPPINVAQALIDSWHLSDSKLEAMHKADETLHEQLAQLHEDESLDRSDQRESMNDARETFHKALENVLSPAQLAALDRVGPPREFGMGPPHDMTMGKKAPDNVSDTHSPDAPESDER